MTNIDHFVNMLCSIKFQPVLAVARFTHLFYFVFTFVQITLLPLDDRTYLIVLCLRLYP